MEIVHTPNDRNATFAIAGGNHPRVSFPKMGFSDEQLEACLSTEQRLEYLKVKEYENWGSIPLFSTLYSIFSEGKPLILYTAEDGECDTCLDIFLKYGEGQRPNLDELMDMRTCMDDYDGDINPAFPKIYT